MDQKKGKAKSAKTREKRTKVFVEKSQWTEPKGKTGSHRFTADFDDVAKQLFVKEMTPSSKKTPHKSGRELIKEMKRRKSLTLKMMKTGMQELKSDAIDVTPRLSEPSENQTTKREKFKGASAKKNKDLKVPTPKKFKNLSQTSTPKSDVYADDDGDDTPKLDDVHDGDDDGDLNNTFPFDADAEDGVSKDDSDIISFPKTPELSAGGRKSNSKLVDETMSPNFGNKTPMPTGKEKWLDVQSARKIKTSGNNESKDFSPKSGKNKDAISQRKRKRPTNEANDEEKKLRVVGGDNVESEHSKKVVVVDKKMQKDVEEKNEKSSEDDEHGSKRKRKPKKDEFALFCGNIPDQETTEFLKFYFAEADCFPQIRAKKHTRGGKNRQMKQRNVILICNSGEEMERLLELDKSMIPSVQGGMERTLQIHPLMNRADQRSKHKVFVKNIHERVTKKELMKFFRDGGHKAVKVHLYSNRGQAYVWFLSPQEAKRVVKMKERTLRGNRLNLKYCKTRHQYGQAAVPENES